MKLTARNSALFSGVALWIMAVLAIFTFGWAHHNLVDVSNPELTIRNIFHQPYLFTAEVIGWIIILLLDILVSFSLLSFFRNDHSKLATMMAFLRLIYSLLFGFAIFHLVLAVLKINDVLPYTNAYDIIWEVNRFEKGWSSALILFGFHLLTLGVLAFETKTIPRIWGILLFFAGISYVAVHGLQNYFPQHETFTKTLESILMLPMMVGELGFATYLIFKGGKISKAV